MRFCRLENDPKPKLVKAFLTCTFPDGRMRILTSGSIRCECIAAVRSGSDGRPEYGDVYMRLGYGDNMRLYGEMRGDAIKIIQADHMFVALAEQAVAG